MRVPHKTLSMARLIHVYVSMALLTLLLFFSVTGITLNHPEWFAQHSPQVNEGEWNISPELLENPPLTPLQLVKVQAELEQLTGKNLSQSIIESGEAEVYFALKKAGANTSISIDLETGEAFFEHTDYGWWAWLNDLHKGRNTSLFWSVVIDLSSVLFIIFAVTGFILAMPQRRFTRTLTAGIATTVVTLLIAALLS